MDLDSFVMDGNREPGEGILRLVPGAADGHARRLHGTGFLSLLCVLGSDAGPDVPADRNLGRTTETVRCDQILSVYACRISANAAGRAVPIFPSSRGNRGLHVWTGGALSDGTEDLF